MRYLTRFMDWLTSAKIWKRICICSGLMYAYFAFDTLHKHERFWGYWCCALASLWFFYALHLHDRMNDSR